MVGTYQPTGYVSNPAQPQIPQQAYSYAQQNLQRVANQMPVAITNFINSRRPSQMLVNSAYAIYQQNLQNGQLGVFLNGYSDRPITDADAYNLADNFWAQCTNSVQQNVEASKRYAGYQQMNQQVVYPGMVPQQPQMVFPNQPFGSINMGMPVQNYANPTSAPAPIDPNSTSIYTRHEKRRQETLRNASPTQTLASNFNQATYTQPAPVAKQPKVNTAPKPKYTWVVSGRVDEQTKDTLDSIDEELHRSFEYEEPEIVELRKFNQSTGEGEIVDSANSVELDLKYSVDSVIHGVNDAFGGYKDKFLKFKEFAHIVNANFNEVIYMNFETCKKHFDNVMEVVNEYDKRNIEAIVPGTGTIFNFDGYMNYVQDVLKKLKEQGGTFGYKICDKIVTEFNRAASVLVYNVAQDGQILKLTAEDIDDLGSLCVPHERLDQAYRKYWPNKHEWYDALVACLEASLFAIFRKNEQCYLDPISNMTEIATCCKTGVKVDGGSLRKIYAAMTNIDDNASDIAFDAFNTVFVYTIRRKIMYHNFELEFEYKDEFSDKLNVISENKSYKHIAYYLLTHNATRVSVTDARVRKSPVLLVKHNEEIDMLMPKVCGVSYDGNVVTRKTVV